MGRVVGARGIPRDLGTMSTRDRISRNRRRRVREVELRRRESIFVAEDRGVSTPTRAEVERRWWAVWGIDRKP